MGGLNGQRIHEASYTNVNQFEEIRSLSMVPSKALAFVAETLTRVARGLEENGHSPCQLVYTDNPIGMISQIFFDIYSFFITAEWQFHEKITPSLMQDVEHVKTWTDLPTFTASATVESAYTNDIINMDILCSDIIESVDLAPSSHSSLLVVAIAVHSAPTASGQLKIDAIQLRTAHHRYVFKVCHKILYLMSF
jgi:hypothetical protein